PAAPQAPPRPGVLLKRSDRQSRESAQRRTDLAHSAAPGSCMSSQPGVLAICLALALAAFGAPLPANPELDGLQQRRVIDPAAMTPRATPSPGLRESWLSPSDAARQVQRRYGGRVLSVQAQGEGNYRIKVLKDGEVRTYDINS